MRIISSTFALIHSPLTGPEVWLPAASRLHDLGYATIVPNLLENSADPSAYWLQHINSAVVAISAESQAAGNEPVVLVAHSGAGQLLGSIGARLAHAPAAYLFVDAGLPPQVPSTRLDAIRAEGGDWADEFEQYLRNGGRFPAWTDADLLGIIPNAADRRMVLGNLRPRGLDYFTESLEVTPEVNALPGAYLQFTPTYRVYAETASSWGWPVRSIKAGHFHMLVDPNAVSAEIVALAGRFSP